MRQSEAGIEGSLLVSIIFTARSEDEGLTSQARAPPSVPSPGLKVYMATVPPGVSPGGEFNVMVNSHPVRVTCPENVSPGMQIRIRLEEQQGALHQTFEVAVPPGVRPGQPFALLGEGGGRHPGVSSSALPFVP